MKDEVIGVKSLKDFSYSSAFILPPSSFPIVPLAVPYWSKATYREILRGVLSAGVIDGVALEQLCALICETLNVKTAILCGSGSLALELALRAVGVQHGDEVVIPAFCCSAVVLPILAVGATPVLADVGDELNLTVETVDAVLTRKTKAIIVPHLFGNPADIGAIVALARAKSIRVIDDAAQALGATIDSQAVGTFGDIGILSFGKEKICAGLGGGVVLSTSRNSQAGDLTERLSQPTVLPTLHNLFSTLLWHRWRRWTLPLERALAGGDSRCPDTPAKAYRKETMANLNAAVARTLMQILRENIDARRVRMQLYRELLGDVGGLELIAHCPGSVALAQVVRIAARRRSHDPALAVVNVLANAGYEVQGSYVPVHQLANCSMCVWDRLPYVDRVWADLIELPCGPGVALERVEQIAEIVKGTLRSS